MDSFLKLQLLFQPYRFKSIVQGGSNMTGTDFFFFVTINDKHLLAHVSLQHTPLRSQHIFSNVLEAS